MTPNLFSFYADAMACLSPSGLADPHVQPSLKIDGAVVGDRQIDLVYAPFEHINRDARIAIVGLTPGKLQASNALKSATEALQRGLTAEDALRCAKAVASFSGPMRANLVAMLDHIGVNGLLGLRSTSTLWEERSDLAHFTSALRYPAFVDGENWSGQPDMVRTPPMRQWLEAYTGTELALLRNAVLVPLGPRVTSALQHLAKLGRIDGARILEGLPHPSGSNAERIAFFLNRKPAHLCSSKTNPIALDTARAALVARVSRLRV
ncbi:hypothetical protein [Sphingomonas dokdonensis]|uniref:Uracil DNA glycosylase superfamily protein n=1 Tax=Sphingomonas dokdonensis TaxID=344880 RepID=A0A245ZV66_9SPHN|nr:hypothetical protein [Sphingomonas dokdonensis]OWK33644.1 hypothetical protein SPDO_05250 [Sphingomonas dokdonensis]